MLRDTRTGKYVAVAFLLALWWVLEWDNVRYEEESSSLWNDEYIHK
jgi:hypothetical protein